MFPLLFLYPVSFLLFMVCQFYIVSFPSGLENILLKMHCDKLKKHSDESDDHHKADAKLLVQNGRGGLISNSWKIQLKDFKQLVLGNIIFCQEDPPMEML